MAEVVGKFDSLQFGDKIYQVKLPNDLAVQIECDHEFEITGKTGHEYAVAIPDGPVVINRINGQTRRKSLNLFNDYKEITINAGSEQWYYVSNATLKSWGLVVGRTYTLYMWNCPTNFVAQLPNNSYDNFSSNPYTLTFTDSTSYRIGHNSNLDAKTFTPMISILEGTYTLDTMPPFESYNNTLVNSKCNLRSTGRNFYNSNTFYTDNNITLSGTKITCEASDHDYVTILPKQKFVFLKGVTYFFRKLNATGTLPYGRIVVKGTPWSTSSAENGDAWYFDTNNTSFTALKNFELDNFRFVKKSSGDAYSFDLQITIEKSEELIPYEESTCDVNVELGEYDYIDNKSSLLVRQTSNIITYDGSDDEGWVGDGVDSSTGMGRFRTYLTGDFYGEGDRSSTKGVVNLTRFNNNLGGSAYSAKEEGWNFERRPEGFKLAFTTTIKTVEEWKSFLKSNPIQVVYKLATPTTETIQIKSGYQVWNGGLQIQETETIPYILEKEYAISVYDQILSNTEIISSINTPQVEDTTLVL